MADELRNKLVTTREIAVSALAVVSVAAAVLTWAYTTARSADDTYTHANKVPAIEEKLDSVEQGINEMNDWRVRKDAADAREAAELQRLREQQLVENAERRITEREVMRRLDAITRHLGIAE